MNRHRLAIMLWIPAVVLVGLSCNLPFFQRGSQTEPLDGDEQVLSPGEVVTGPEGIMLGAVEDTLEESVEIEFELTENPISEMSLPEGAVQESAFYFVSASRSVFPEPEAPFIIGVPVPEGAPVHQLALATTVRTEDIDLFQAEDGDEGSDDLSDLPDMVWDVLSGRYDEANNLFLTPIYSLATEGRTVVLISGERFSSPSALPETNAQSQPDHKIASLNAGANGRELPANSMQMQSGLYFTVECVGYTAVDDSVCVSQLRNTNNMLD